MIKLKIPTLGLRYPYLWITDLKQKNDRSVSIPSIVEYQDNLHLCGIGYRRDYRMCRVASKIHCCSANADDHCGADTADSYIDCVARSYRYASTFSDACPSNSYSTFYSYNLSQPYSGDDSYAYSNHYCPHYSCLLYTSPSPRD